MNTFAVLAVLACALLVTRFFLQHVALKGLSVSRLFGKPAVFAGEEGELVETVINDRPMLIPWLRVESRIPAALRLGRQENLEVSGDLYHQSLFTVMPYQRIIRRHRVRFLRRGVFDVGNAALTAGDVTGLITATREQQMAARVIVYPRPMAERELPEPFLRLTGEEVLQRRLLSDPFLIRGLRPYLPGDPVRDIHWPATARSGITQLRLHDDTAAVRLLVVINGQLRENQWDQLADWEEEIIERNISMAAALCLRALRQGMAAGFAANLMMDTGEAVFLPEGGDSRAEALLTAMARLKMRRTLSFPSFLSTLNPRRGTDIAVISAYDSPEIQRQLARLRQMGCSTLLHLSGRGEADA